MGNTFRREENLNNNNSQQNINNNDNNNLGSNENENNSNIEENALLQQLNNSLLNSIFRNNNILNSDEQRHLFEVKSKKIKKTKAFNNPILLKKDSLKFDKKADDDFIFYVNFKYINKSNKCKGTMLLNPEFKNGSLIKNKNFKEICFNLNYSEIEETFSDKELFIDINQFLTYKTYDINFYDLVIILECYNCEIKIEKKDEENKSNKNDDDKIVLMSSFKLIFSNDSKDIKCFNDINNKIDIKDFEENRDFNKNIKDIKSRLENQRLLIKNKWYDMVDIFGLSTNPNK